MTSRRPKQVSLHGKRDYLTTEGEHVTKEAFATGGEFETGNTRGTIVMPGSPSRVAVWDDFLGDLIGDEWAPVRHDTGHTAAASAAGVNGLIQTTVSGKGDLCVPAESAGVTGGTPQWKANAGNLRVGARVKMSAVAGLELFVGLTDSGGSEMPAYDTGTLTANATSAAGFLYAPQSGSDHWRGVATGAAISSVTDTGAIPVANVWDVLELDFGSDSGQYVNFYRNNTYVGRIANPVNAATALTPAIIGYPLDTGETTFEVDWINVSANRDTGT